MTIFFSKIFSCCSDWLQYCAHIHVTVNEIIPDDSCANMTNDFLSAVTNMKTLFETTEGAQFLESCAFLDKTNEGPRHSTEVTNHVENFLAFIVDTQTLLPLAQTIAKVAARLWHGSIWFL